MESVRRRVGRTASVVSDSLQRRHRPDYQIILFIGLLMLFGLVIMYAIGPQRANVLNSAYGTDFYTETYFVIKQSISLVLSVAVFMLMATVPFAIIKSHAGRLVWIGFALAVLLFITGNVLHIDSVAKCSLGACRWFNLGPLGSFQPAEALKFAVLIFLASFLGMRSQQGKIDDMERTIIPAVSLVGAALFFVVILQKDMGTGIALSAIALTMFLVSGMKWKIIAKIVAVAAVLGILMIVTSPHRMERVGTFFQGDSAGESVQDDNNYHIKNAKIALGTGGFLGLGIGNSVQATGYLPEAINDSVFAIIGETFGFIGVTLILVLFTALLIRLLKISDHLPDMSMRLAVAGIFGWLAAHIILNVASMIGVFPLTGITLPLLSFGGTSMLFIAGALGLAFQLSRYTSHGQATKETGYEDSSSRRRVGGSRNSSRRRTTRN